MSKFSSSLEKDVLACYDPAAEVDAPEGNTKENPRTKNRKGFLGFGSDASFIGKTHNGMLLIVGLASVLIQ